MCYSRYFNQYAYAFLHVKKSICAFCIDFFILRLLCYYMHTVWIYILHYINFESIHDNDPRYSLTLVSHTIAIL